MLPPSKEIFDHESEKLEKSQGTFSSARVKGDTFTEETERGNMPVSQHVNSVAKTGAGWLS